MILSLCILYFAVEYISIFQAKSVWMLVASDKQFTICHTIEVHAHTVIIINFWGVDDDNIYCMWWLSIFCIHKSPTMMHMYCLIMRMQPQQILACSAIHAFASTTYTYYNYCKKLYKLILLLLWYYNYVVLHVH